jgi:integrase
MKMYIKEPKLRSQRGVYYIEFYQNDKRRRKSLHTKDEKLAEVKFRKFLYEYENKLIPESGRLTLRQYLDMKLKEYKINKSEDRHRSIKRVCTYINECFGDEKFLDDIKPSDGKKFISFRKKKGHLGNAKIRKKIKNKTLNNDIHIFKQIFKEAFEEDIILKFPFHSLKYLSTRDSEDRDALTESELNKMLSDEVPLIYRKFFMFLVLTGCRRSEAINLEWNRVNFVDHEIYIPSTNTKNNKPKVITMSKEVEKLLKSTDRTSHLVFTNRNKRKHQNISTIFTYYRKKLGIRDGITLHCLRHTTATYLIRLGYPLPFVSKMLGHSDIRTTMDIYGHLKTKDLEDMAQNLGNKITKIHEEMVSNEENIQ